MMPLPLSVIPAPPAALRMPPLTIKSAAALPRVRLKVMPLTESRSVRLALITEEVFVPVMLNTGVLPMEK